jgi:hypothetical protein
LFGCLENLGKESKKLVFFFIICLVLIDYDKTY